MRLVLDAGALIALDRADRRLIGLLELGRRAGAELVTSSPVVAQAWRDGARQARLAKGLSMIDVRPVDDFDAKRAGELLAVARTSDVVDALVALLAQPADQLLTSDPEDMIHLLSIRGVPATVVTV